MTPRLALSQTTEYALRATLFIAQQAPLPARLPDVAEAIHAPQRYLAKILGQLARAGVLTSARGRAGGFRLSPGTEHASLSSIIAVFEEPERRRCLLGRGVCGQNPGCAVHEKWSPIGQSAAAFFADTTIGELLSVSPLS
jgi:Rrf2 family transcriptional regulator, nitric oxide-sensitive transcriptional repressor